MTLTFARPLLAAIAALALTACVESSREDATGKGSMRGVNAIVNAPDVAFRIEQIQLGLVSYGNVTSPRRFDDLFYNFNFQATLPGESSPRRLASIDLDAAADTAYLFVLDGTFANPELRLWEQPERAWQSSETVFELNFGHLNDTSGPVDFYVSAPGVAPAPGNAVTTLADGEFDGPYEFPEGDYVISATPAGDPQTILYQSATREFLPAATSTILLFEADPSRTGALLLRLFSATGEGVELPDPRFAPEVRVLHAAAGIGPIDLAEEGDFADLVAANLGYGEMSDDVPVAAGTHSFTATAAGNPGAIVVEEDETVTVGFFETLTLVGPSDDPEILNTPSQRRPFVTSGRLGVVHAASAFDLVDVYLLPAGTALDNAIPLLNNIAFRLGSGLAPIAANNYEVTVTVDDAKTVLAGPEPVAIANGDVIEIFIIDTADPNAAALRIVRYAP